MPRDKAGVHICHASEVCRLTSIVSLGCTVCCIANEIVSYYAISLTRNVSCVIEEGNFEPNGLRLIAKICKCAVASLLCCAVLVLFGCGAHSTSAVSKEPRLRVEISSSKLFGRKLKLPPRYCSF